jgi:hypothetical protein
MAGNCRSCGALLPGEAKFCMSCGTPAGGNAAARAVEEEDVDPELLPAPPPKSNTVLILVLVAAGLLVGGIVVIAIIAAIVIPNLLVAKQSANETAAIATMLNLNSCQAQIQISGKIDCDGDGIGEYGTLGELTGANPVRAAFHSPRDGETAGSDFSTLGSTIRPPILSGSLAAVHESGLGVKSGYCFVVYLPDSSKAGGWTHEARRSGDPSLTGGTGRVGVDAAERRWCAYAWPVSMNNSGKRCFFVDQEGTVLQSMNEAGRHTGVNDLPAPDSAGLAGQKGGDGDTWTVVNRGR